MNRRFIGNSIFVVSLIALLVANWHDYAWHIAVEKYNIFFAAIILSVILICYADNVYKLLKDWHFILVVVTNVLSLALNVYAMKSSGAGVSALGFTSSLVVFNITITSYLMTKVDLAKENKVTYLYVICIFVALFFIYWTIDVKGYYKGYSTNYGGLVLLSGFIFAVIIFEYIKLRFVQSKSFLGKYRFFLTFFEIALFYLGYKIMAWYQSRTAFFTMLVFGVLLFTSEVFIINRISRNIIIGLSLLGGYLFPMIYIYIGNSFQNEEKLMFYKPVFSVRMDVWPRVLDLIKNFSFTGIGSMYMSGSDIFRDGYLDCLNSFLGIAVSSGVIVAILTTICIFVSIYKISNRAYDSCIGRAALAGIISCIFASYTESFITTVPFMIVFMLLGVTINSVETGVLTAQNAEVKSSIAYYKELMKSEFGRRFIRTLIPIFSFAFMYFIFGPIEIFYSNYDELIFNVTDFAILFAILSIVCSIAVSLVIATLPEKVSIIISAAVTGIIVASYTQYLFFNVNLVDEFGIFVSGKSIGIKYYISITLYVIIVALFIILGTKFKYRDELKIYASSIVMLVQLVALISIMIPLVKLGNKGDYIRIFDTEKQFEVGSDENIIIIMLDTFCRNYFEDVEIEWPERMSILKDFTYYTNANSVYAPTFPSVVHSLTDYEYEEDMVRREYEREALNSEGSKSFWNKLKSAGYDVNMYTTDMIMSDYLETIFDNVKVVKKTNNYKSIYNIMLKQSMYRYSPYFLKPCFEWTLDEAKYTYAYDDAQHYYDNVDAYKALDDMGITVSDDSSKKFIYNHFQGAHSFPTNDENLNRVMMSSVPDYKAGAGSLLLVEKYLDELRKLDKYDSSNIIVMADHGCGNYPLEPIFFVKRKGEKHEEYCVDKNSFSYCDFNKLILDFLE